MDIQMQILERITRIEEKIDGYNGLKDKVDANSRVTEVQEEKLRVANKRIADLEEKHKWLGRTLAGAIILSFLARYLNWG